MAERYVIEAQLRPGRRAEAEEELRAGPPFDPAEVGLTGHSAHLTDDHAYLVFEGDSARAKALQLARSHVVEISRWQAIVTGLPRTVDDVPPGARCLFDWHST